MRSLQLWFLWEGFDGGAMSLFFGDGLIGSGLLEHFMFVDHVAGA